MEQVGLRETSVANGRLLRIAVLTTAWAMGTASYAQGAVFWSDSSPGFSRPGPTTPLQRRPNPRRFGAKKIGIPGKEAAKPQGPLIIAISIDRQNLKVYDANGFYAETSISTGMRGHSTPMGVFSVIQKQKLHHSNIYSGAPMPFMQRITWSGIAMHAGVLPGYPASHGCIRMPMAFAVKMWNWTRMGARVVVTPGEIIPSRFSHPLLVAQKVAPQPVAAAEPQTPVMGQPAAATPLRDQTRTANADSTSQPAQALVTMSDAGPDNVSVKPGHASDDPKIEAAKSEAEPATAKPDETASSDDKSVEAQSSEAAAPVADTPKPEPSKSADRTDDPIKSVAGAVPDVKKDQTRLPDTEKATAANPAPAAASAVKRAGQISVFVSRKDQKLYARQNFEPLFDSPVTIAPDERPLGTHVFTAQADKDNANLLRWSVVSLPAPDRHAERRDEDERALRRRKIAGVVEMKPVPVPDSPAEALNRLSIPADAMARITDALSTGGSIIVSDQGITAGETGEGTDFIVSLR